MLSLLVAAPTVARAQHGRPRPALEPPLTYTRLGPGACLQLPSWIEHLRLEGLSDTGRFTPEGDRLSPEAQAAMGRCRAAMDQPSAPAWQWPALARLALAVGDEAAAERWHAQYLTSVAEAPLPRRAWAQYRVMSAYAAARPPRLAAAGAALRTLDAMGAPAARARVLAHLRLMEAARRQWDDTLRVREAHACLRAYRELPPAFQTLLMEEAQACVLGAAEVLLRRQGAPPALAVLDTGLAVVPKGSRAARALTDQRARYALVGAPAMSIEATRWFRRQGAAPKPARGVVTLLHEVSHASGKAAQYQALRRLAARFAGRPFELIAQAKTLGFIGDSAVPMPPEREIGLDSAYFYGYARMPGMLAVYATAFRMGVDGRRLEQPTPQERHYRGAPLVLVDKRGLVRYMAQGWAGPQEELLARLIETLLAES